MRPIALLACFAGLGLLAMPGCGSSPAAPAPASSSPDDVGVEAEVEPPPKDPTLDPGIVSQGTTSGREAESRLAVSSDGRVAIGWIGLQSPARIGYVISKDRGASFAPLAQLPQPDKGDAADPVLAADRAGNLYVVWLGFKVDTSGMTYDTHVFVAKSPAGSTSFGPPVEITDPTDEAVIDKPHLTVTGAGTVIATYMRQTGLKGKTTSLVAARSKDGETWTRAIVVDEGVAVNHLAAPCAAPTGDRVYVVHVQYKGSITRGRTAFLRFSDDGGATWPSTNVTQIAPDSDIGFDDVACASDGTQTWVLYGLTHDSPSADEFGNLYAIRLAHSPDAGVTIDAHYDVHDPSAGSLFLHPQLAREDDGSLDVAYYAGSDPDDPAGTVRRTRSTDGGKTFAPSVVLHAPVEFLDSRVSPRWIGDYFGLASSQGNVYVSYADNSGKASHIAFLRTAARMD